ncbi:hypothetical protein C0J52_23726 [Blattella germanica]|nr:hypothetical protein C0J52_23726 [Blattella germanica]
MSSAKFRVYQTNHTTTNELKCEIAELFNSVTNEILIKVFENKVKRVDVCIEENGGHFQHLL